VKRHHQWSSRMYAVIEAHRHLPFEWGVNDCCLFVSRAYDAMTDSAVTYLIRERYHDHASALRFIAEYGSLEAAVSRYLGDPSTDRAVRGDPVLIDGGEGYALGLCIGSKVVAMGPSGLRELPRSSILKVWHG
jgi:hypothetical protein